MLISNSYKRFIKKKPKFMNNKAKWQKVDFLVMDFVFQFAKDLKELLELLEIKFGKNLWISFQNNHKYVIKASTKLTKELYEKYNEIFDLQLGEKDGECNLEFNTSYNDKIIIPKNFFESKTYSTVKDDYDVLFLIMKRNILTWEEFVFRLTHIFPSNSDNIKKLRSSTLEKIRFFMTFINEFPDYITGTKIPLEAKNLKYKSIYSRWGRHKTYYNIYERYIHHDANFFKNHLRIFPIPNYNIWNLNIVVFESGDVNNPDLSRIPSYPIQVFENADGSFNSSLMLMDKNVIYENKKGLKEFVVEKFSIINNFNNFKQEKQSNASIKLRTDSFFEIYVNYIDDLHIMKEGLINKYKNYENTFNFSRIDENQNIANSIKNKDTIKMFNLLYHNSDFKRLYSSSISRGINPYRILFKNRYSFPDFNLRDNFLLIISKKKNSLFQKTISFFKYWSYQCLTYEMKNKILFYGFLPIDFDLNKEMIYINEVLESLNTDYKFFICNKDVKQSTLSLYSLPDSKQFIDNESYWDLNKYDLRLSILQKENIITTQINEEIQP